jgi:hypothetical protein
MDYVQNTCDEFHNTMGGRERGGERGITEAGRAVKDLTWSDVRRAGDKSERERAE